MTPSSYDAHLSSSQSQQTDIVVDVEKPDTTDIEAQFLLQEFNDLRAEIIARQGFQLQYMNIAILLLGGVMAAFPLIIVTNSGVVKIPLPYLTLGLLVLSLIYISLLWAMIDSDIEQASLGTYMHQVTRTRAAALLSIDSNQEIPILEWEAFRSRSTQANSIAQVPQYIVFVMRGISRYMLFFLPAIATLLMAGILLFDVSEFPFTDLFSWLTFTFFVIDCLYLFAIVPIAFYIASLYKQIVPRGGDSAKRKRR